MATEFWISYPKLHKIGHNSYHMQHNFIFSAIVVFSGLVISNSLPTFSRDVAMATKVTIYYINLVKKTPSVCTAYSIFLNLLVAQGSAISDVLLKFTGEVAMATEFWISQPKLHKIGHNSDHMHHNLIFSCYSGVFVVGDLKFVTYVFKGRCHGNQTEFIIHKFGKNSSHMHCIFNIFVSAGGFKMMISDMLLKFTMEVAMAKKFYI